MTRKNTPRAPAPTAPSAHHAAAAEAFATIGELAGSIGRELSAGALYQSSGAQELAAPDALRPPVRLGATVLWQVPDEWRRYDTSERLGDEVPAVIARAHDDGAVDLHPLPPLGAPALRAELTWRVAPGAWRYLED